MRRAMRVQPFRRAQFRNLGRLAKSHVEHDRVVLAILRGDRAGAAGADARAHHDGVRGIRGLRRVGVNAIDANDSLSPSP